MVSSDLRSNDDESMRSNMLYQLRIEDVVKKIAM